MAATAIQLFAATGPNIYGIFNGRSNSHVQALIVAAVLSLGAALLIPSGRGVARRLPR